ncbi:hypothetical protein MPPM_4720 [Methylorubrum populi]|uniref:Uncharacterized protein n=2 Tax=Methylorubrum populi TaxID=223967 RepID=A0A160PK12_9HYPH|nr:hypothetical protein MPPM_4720 [Methylorubrum populi]
MLVCLGWNPVMYIATHISRDLYADLRRLRSRVQGLRWLRDVPPNPGAGALCASPARWPAFAAPGRTTAPTSPARRGRWARSPHWAASRLFDTRPLTGIEPFLHGREGFYLDPREDLERALGLILRTDDAQVDRTTAAAQAPVQRIDTFDALARYVIEETLAPGPVARPAPPPAGKTLVKAEASHRQPSMNRFVEQIRASGPAGRAIGPDESGRAWPSGLTTPTMRAAMLTRRPSQPI